MQIKKWDFCQLIKKIRQIHITKSTWGKSRHPGYDISAFTKNICEILHNLSDKKLPFIICEDININLMQQTAIPQARNYVNAYKSYNCLDLITKPTRTAVLNWGCSCSKWVQEGTSCGANFSDNTKNNTSNGARGAKMIFPSRPAAGFKMN